MKMMDRPLMICWEIQGNLVGGRWKRRVACAGMVSLSETIVGL